jgi:hypothetical protein
MASRRSPYHGHSISAESRQGEIQLSDRQMQLLEARKRAKETGLQTSQFKGSNNSGAKRDPTPRMDNKATQGNSWSDEQTVPTTWSDSSSSANSSVSKASSRAVSSVVSAAMSKASSGSRVNPAKKFYGQGLNGQTKKLFDDSGASYHGSRSEASSIMSRKMMNKQSQQEPEMMPRRVNRVPRQQAPTQATSKPQEAAPLATGDQQKAFLRKMMKSYTTKPSKGGKDKADETASEVSSANESTKRGSWVDRKSKAASSASSGSSSASHDRAIMRKVLERARNKKMALSNPRKQGLLKQSSSRMKKLLSPKQDKSLPRTGKSASPSSHTSSNSGSQSSKRFGFGSMLSTKKKKASRSPRFSSRNAKTRVYNKPDSLFPADQAYPNDEATAPKKSLERNFDTLESTASTASETISNTEPSTKTGDISKPVKKLYDDSGASVALSETASETFGTKKNSTDMSMTSKPGYSYQEASYRGERSYSET